MKDSFDSANAEECVRQVMAVASDAERKARFCLYAGGETEKYHDYNVALACYLQAFSLRPERNDVWYFLNNNVGFCLNQLGRYDEAEPDCREAIRINPHWHNAYKNLGVALEGRGNYVEATRLFLRAIQIVPGDTRALMHLELVFRDHPEIVLDIPDIESIIQQAGRLVETARRSWPRIDPSLNN